ncbi:MULTISPECIES: LysR substrate-binding domain-containing protein [Serratia]|uniref:LysR substrate-binding domain-containing protein n=1 Tax=Serratia TaxID=613 RepID=UPI00030D0C57|nr:MULTISPECIES: LysR substrate-binding domain-containing protein [Serratia]UTN97777.1 LysR substrate-binding domain-containing protein [Serratia plymuthica]
MFGEWPRVVARDKNEIQHVHLDQRQRFPESVFAFDDLTRLADIDIRVVATERLMIALPEHHPLAAEPAVALKDLSGIAFDKVPHLHSKLLMACDEAGFSPQVVTEP